MLKVNVNVVIYSKEDKILNDFKCAFEKESKYFNNNIQTIKETKELKEIEKVDLLIVVFNEKTINCTKILSNKTEKIIIVDLKNELIKDFQLNTIEGIKNKDFRVIAFSIAFGFYNELRNRDFEIQQNNAKNNSELNNYNKKSVHKSKKDFGKLFGNITHKSNR